MAKTVAPVAVELGIKGGEKLGKLNSAFRDLAKTINQSDKSLEDARQGVIEYGKGANDSIAVINGQIKALEGLREQAAMGGKVYQDLSGDIAELKSRLDGSTPAIDAQRKSLLETTNTARGTQAQLLSVANALSALQKQTALGSKAFLELGTDIQGLQGKIAKLKTEQQDLQRVNLALNASATSGEAATRRQIKAIDEKVASLREDKKVTEELNKQAKVRLGLQTLLERARDRGEEIPFRDKEYIEQAIAESLITGGRITERFNAKEIEAAINVVKRSVAELQSDIEVELGRSARRTFQEMARKGRESARSLAQAFSGPEFQRIFTNLTERVGEVPNTTAGLSQSLRELEGVLNNTARGGDNYVAVALQIARVQREASAATQGLGAALIDDLASGKTVRSQRNLREAIGQLQAEMSELNTETQEGSQKYAENARQVNNLQKELDDIANSYRTVTQVAREAAAAGSEYANTRTVANYLSRGVVRAREQATADLARSIAEAARSTPLALPAAGQTTAPGTGAFMSGGAEEYIPLESRIGGRTGETPDRPSRAFPGDVQAIGGRRPIGPEMTPQQADAYRRSQISAAEATRQRSEAEEAARRVAEGYRLEISKARDANNGSIDSTQRLKSSLEAYRNTLAPTTKDFKTLTAEIVDLDRKSERLSRKMRGRRMSAGQITQAAGATLSGGIFGGPEGFLGGAFGTVVGGVGGAFAGAAAGAQIGQLRQQVGQFTEYSAQISKLQIALRGAAGSQEEFNRAVEAANSATTELNVPQEEAIRGMTRLTAAVKGAGGQVSDAELVFRNVSSAIKATGGNAQDVDSALTAMVQVFSKGKVSAEELSGQLGERLPGAVTKFAKANKLTLPELQKALKAGTVGLNELMRFIEALGEEYDGTSKKIASSSEEAGARLQIAYDEMRISVGSALEPIGAQFQDAFARFIYEYTPELTAAAQFIGNAMLALSKVLKPILAGLASFAAVFAAGKLAAFIKGVTGSLGLFGVTTKAAAGSVAALTAAMLANPLFLGAAAVGGIVAGIVLITDALGKQRRELKALNDEMARRAPSLSANERNIAITENRRELDLIKRDLEKLENPDPGSRLARLARRSPDAVKREIVALKNRRLELLKAQRELTKSTALGTSDTDFESPKPDGSGAGSGSRSKDISDLQLAARLAKIIAGRREASFETRRKALLLQREAAVKASEELDANRQIAAILQASENYRRGILRLEKDITNEANKRATTDFKKRYGFDPGFEGKIFTELTQSEFDPDVVIPSDFDMKVDSLKEGLEELIDPLNQINGAAQAIGEAFSSSFTAAINGSVSAQQALADFFSNVGNYFLDMAGQIIQKMIQIAILNSFANLFPGSGGISGVFSGYGGLSNGSFFSGGGGSDFPVLPKGTKLFGGGGVFNGGLVKKPTMFAYANGGAGNFGLMGEAGPEAILPLRRTSGGKLGVEASGGMGNVVVNVDASGTNVQGDDRQASQLGRLIGAAVQSELVKQKRPGGLLAG